jgi:hypothetical protein
VARVMNTQTSWNVTGTPSRCGEHAMPENKLATQWHSLFSKLTFVFPYERVSTVGTACSNNTLGSRQTKWNSKYGTTKSTALWNMGSIILAEAFWPIGEMRFVQLQVEV